jgi:hypothetical protein
LTDLKELSVVELAALIKNRAEDHGRKPVGIYFEFPPGPLGIGEEYHFVEGHGVFGRAEFPKIICIPATMDIDHMGIKTDHNLSFIDLLTIL